jgi:hypothetical protein
MGLQISKALEKFNLADYVDLNCGDFDVKIKAAAMHNEGFRAAVAKRAVVAKKKSLAVDKDTITGNFEEDVKLFIEEIIVGWGDRPLMDDNGKEVEANAENLFELFTSTKQGRILFSKIHIASVDDELFKVTEEDLKN